jgi:hypothetical protein
MLLRACRFFQTFTDGLFLPLVTLREVQKVSDVFSSVQKRTAKQLAQQDN